MAIQTKPKPKPKGKGKGKGSLGFLMEKKGPLPVWAWAAMSAVLLFLLYRHFKGGGSKSAATANAPADSTQPADTSGAGDFGGTGGGGSSPTDTSGDLSNTSPFSTGFELPYGYGGGQGFPSDLTTLPDGTNPSATTGIGGVGPLNWGNEHFTSRAQFESWLTSRGGSIASFRVTHPAAYAHYLALPSGKSRVKAQKKSTTRATGTKRSSTRTSLTKAAKSIATGVSGATPRKTTVRGITKSPLTGVSHVLTQAGSNGRVSALHPSALTGGANTRTKVAPKVPTASKTPKVAAKPKPVATPIITKRANAGPPAKRKK